MPGEDRSTWGLRPVLFRSFGGIEATRIDDRRARTRAEVRELYRAISGSVAEEPQARARRAQRSVSA
jgi:hypothetical protein